MFLNLTQHLVEKVMLQNIKTTTTTTATTVSDQQQQRFYAIQRPIQKKNLNVRSSSPQVWLRQQKNEEHTLKRRI
jgi:hypothetical protein